MVLVVLVLPELFVELVLATETKLSAIEERLVLRLGRGGGTCLFGVEGFVVEALLGRGGRGGCLGGGGGGISPLGVLRATWSSCNMAIRSLMLVPAPVD